MSPKLFDMQLTVVADVHDEVKQTPCSSPAVAVCSRTPKFSPLMLNGAYPLCGAFSRTSDATAESKLKIGLPVPAADATVTLPLPNISQSPLDTHPTVVAEVHDDVKHTPRSSPALAVASLVPKLTPLTVNDAYPLCAELACATDARAASKLKIGCPVPDTAATVTIADWKRSANAFDRHASVVADVHDKVKQIPGSPLPPRSSPALAV
jgi:hypothetical protein